MAFQGDPAIKEFLGAHASKLCERQLEKTNREPQAGPYFQKLAAEGCLLNTSNSGFLERLDRRDQKNHPIPFIVPGPAADCSVGIAIAHFKAPLQDVVRAAQSAEKRAKRKPESGGLGRKAVAITLMKRSGEIIEWGARWGGGLELYRALSTALERDYLSSKFPHRFAELLEAYVTDTTPMVAKSGAVQPVTGFPVDEVIRREFEHCLLQQRGLSFPRGKSESEPLVDELRAALQTYLESLTVAGVLESHVEKRLRSIIGLCQTVAFAHRTDGTSGANP
jgi:hypothetical protein